MATPEISEALRRSGRLRAEVGQLGREPRRSGLTKRLYLAVVDTVELVTLLVLAADGWIAYQTFR